MAEHGGIEPEEYETHDLAAQLQVEVWPRPYPVRVAIGFIGTTLGLWAATMINGVDFGEGTTIEIVVTVLAVAVFLGLADLIVRPLIQLLGCLLYIATLGLFAFVVNALMLWLTGYLTDLLSLPYQVHGFWPAFWGALILSLVSLPFRIERVRTTAPGLVDETFRIRSGYFR